MYDFLRMKEEIIRKNPASPDTSVSKLTVWSITILVFLMKNKNLCIHVIDHLRGFMSLQDPKYQLVIDWIKENIESGALKYGDRIKSEKELSQQFGLSRQTVRRATSELEKDKILTRVQGSGTYIGDRIQGIRREKHMNVAVMSTYIDSYIFPPTLKGIETVLSGQGYTTQLFFTDDRISQEADILESLLSKNDIDGLIAEPSKSALPNSNMKYYREIARRGIPILFFNASYHSLHMPCVRMDDDSAAKSATELLIKNGHRKIAGLFKCDDGQGHHRYNGYNKALLEAHLRPDAGRVIWIDTGVLSNLSLIKDYIFERLKGCTAVVCYNDEAAFQLINMCAASNIRVPEDLSVVSFDDSDLSRMCQIPFTSFIHPKEELGRKTAENLIRMIEDPGFDASYMFASQPVLRDSIKKLA